MKVVGGLLIPMASQWTSIMFPRIEPTWLYLLQQDLALQALEIQKRRFQRLKRRSWELQKATSQVEANQEEKGVREIEWHWRVDISIYQ